MNKQKRRNGRAIRKQRRENREMLRAFYSIDWDTVGSEAVAAFEQFGKVVAEVAENMGRFFGEFAEAYTESVAQQYRMTHMALTTGEKNDRSQ